MTQDKKWYVLRDLKPYNAKVRAWQILENEMGLEVFTPKKWVIRKEDGKRTPKEVALISDLLFAHETRDILDPIIEKNETLQYRFRKGGAQNDPMTVPDRDMERFIKAVTTMKSPKYYALEEITPEMRHRPIRIVGGSLDGYEGYLLTTRGSRKRRLLVELPNLLAASVEVSPEFIQLI